jgi:hypothetical protein
MIRLVDLAVVFNSDVCKPAYTESENRDVAYSRTFDNLARHGKGKCI